MNHLPTVNKVLQLILGILGIYIFIFPIIPDITFYGEKIIAPPNIESPKTPDKEEQDNSYTGANKLVIPQIGVDGEIFEGENVTALDKGIWHRPKSSTPEMGGNTVLTAHRRMYTTGPNTFYHLDKVKVEESIDLYWNKKKYSYKVFDIREVKPFETWVEDNTEENIITLYTCTPLWTAENRLVVRARLIELK